MAATDGVSYKPDAQFVHPVFTQSQSSPNFRAGMVGQAPPAIASSLFSGRGGADKAYAAGELAVTLNDLLVHVSPHTHVGDNNNTDGVITSPPISPIIMLQPQHQSNSPSNSFTLPRKTSPSASVRAAGTTPKTSGKPAAKHAGPMELLLIPTLSEVKPSSPSHSSSARLPITSPHIISAITLRSEGSALLHRGGANGQEPLDDDDGGENARMQRRPHTLDRGEMASPSPQSMATARMLPELGAPSGESCAGIKGIRTRKKMHAQSPPKVDEEEEL